MSFRVVPCRSSGKVQMEMGGERRRAHFSWDSSLPPQVQLRESPEFSWLCNRDRSAWPRYAALHGWLPGLSGAAVGDTLGDVSSVSLTWSLIQKTSWTFMLRKRLRTCLIILMFGLM